MSFAKLNKQHIQSQVYAGFWWGMSIATPEFDQLGKRRFPIFCRRRDPFVLYISGELFQYRHEMLSLIPITSLKSSIFFTHINPVRRDCGYIPRWMWCRGESRISAGVRFWSFETRWLLCGKWLWSEPTIRHYLITKLLESQQDSYLFSKV